MPFVAEPTEPDAGVAAALAAPRGPLSRAVELLMVGGSTPLLFLLAWLLRRAFGLDDAELATSALFFYGAYVVNDPHFAVTYLLFYGQLRERACTPAQRARYWLAGVVIPLGLLGWAAYALATRSVLSLGALFQLMFLLVGFHYVKQGFGVLSVLAARRGVRFSRWERTALLMHCYAGWAHAWASPADLGTRTEQKGLVYATFAHPPGLESVTQGLFYLSVLPLVWLLVQKRRRERALPLFGPLLAFLCSVWTWTVYSSFDPLVRYAIPALHSLQYLYMVWLWKSNEARERQGPPWFEPSVAVRLFVLASTAVLLGTLLFHVGPSWLDEWLSPHPSRAGALGPTPCFAALFAFVNLHHYFMDMVLWRRDNPHTRHLRKVAANPP